MTKDSRTSARAKAKNCTKGYSCGMSCIARPKNCSNLLNGQSKSYAEWLEVNGEAKQIEESGSASSAAMSASLERKLIRDRTQSSAEDESWKYFASYLDSADKSRHRVPPEKEDLASLMAYTGDYFVEMNSYLRTGVHEGDGSAEDLSLLISAVNRALEDMPIHAGNVYRGGAFGRNLLDNYRRAFESGEEIVERGFTSSTGIEETAINFASDNSVGSGGREVIFEIVHRSGRSIKAISEFPEEEEVLFRSGTRFRVNGFDDSTTPVRILMEELTDG